jgi:hypothetical protein
MDLTPDGATPYGLTPKQLQQIANNDAKAVHREFTETLSLLREQLEPGVRKMYLEDLKDLQQRARQLLDTELIHPITKPLLNHVLLRPIDDIAAINAFRGDGKQIISTSIA